MTSKQKLKARINDLEAQVTLLSDTIDTINRRVNVNDALIDRMHDEMVTKASFNEWLKGGFVRNVDAALKPLSERLDTLDGGVTPPEEPASSTEASSGLSVDVAWYRAGHNGHDHAYVITPNGPSVTSFCGRLRWEGHRPITEVGEGTTCGSCKRKLDVLNDALKERKSR